jgi:hypothetical protein
LLPPLPTHLFFKLCSWLVKVRRTLDLGRAKQFGMCFLVTGRSERGGGCCGGGFGCVCRSRFHITRFTAPLSRHAFMSPHLTPSRRQFCVALSCHDCALLWRFQIQHNQYQGPPLVVVFRQPREIADYTNGHEVGIYWCCRPAWRRTLSQLASHCKE